MDGWAAGVWNLLTERTRRFIVREAFTLGAGRVASPSMVEARGYPFWVEKVRLGYKITDPCKEVWYVEKKTTTEWVVTKGSGEAET